MSPSNVVSMYVVLKGLSEASDSVEEEGKAFMSPLVLRFEWEKWTCSLAYCGTGKGEIMWVVVLWMLTFKADHAIVMAVTEFVDDINQEKATKDPLSPGTLSGSGSEQANTTNGSHVNWIPGVFPGIEDHRNQLQTPLPTSKSYKLWVFSFIRQSVIILNNGNGQKSCVLTNNCKLLSHYDFLFVFYYGL